MSTPTPPTQRAPETGPDRRGLIKGVALSLTGAGITLLAVTRTWSTTMTRRPAPLPPESTAHSGSSHLGWVIALALVGLAGAGALLATRGGARVLIGALLGLVGIVIFGGGLDGLHLADNSRLTWPILVMSGGVLIARSGLLAMRKGSSWPAMGAKYERPEGQRVDRPVTDATMWDDLDRGVDPTE